MPMLKILLVDDDPNIRQLVNLYLVKEGFEVIMASRGYPAAYEKGFPLTIGEDVRERVYVAGAKWKDGVLVTNGGRVLGCTAVADTLEDAIRDAYAITGQIHFENAFFRHDIGQRALKAKEI